MELAGGACKLCILEEVLCCGVTPSLQSAESKLLFHTSTCKVRMKCWLNQWATAKSNERRTTQRMKCASQTWFLFYKSLTFITVLSVKLENPGYNPHLLIRTSRGEVISCPGERHTGRRTLKQEDEEKAGEWGMILEVNYISGLRSWFPLRIDWRNKAYFDDDMFTPKSWWTNIKHYNYLLLFIVSKQSIIP